MAAVVIQKSGGGGGVWATGSGSECHDATWHGRTPHVDCGGGVV